MTQFLPELLLAVLFGIEASFTHPGFLTVEKEKLGDRELKEIIKKTQASSEAREVLAFNPKVWMAMTEALKAGISQLVGSYVSSDPKLAGVKSLGGPVPPTTRPRTPAIATAAAVAAKGSNATAGPKTPGSPTCSKKSPSSTASTPKGKTPSETDKDNSLQLLAKLHRDLTYSMIPPLPSAPLEHEPCTAEHHDASCACSFGADIKTRREKMYLLPRVGDLVVLGRNLLAAKERSQDLAAECRFDVEIRRLCEICVRSTSRESYHKILETCLQFLNNLVIGNEKQKMSLWMHLFVPGSTRLFEAAKRKALRQIKSGAWKAMSAVMQDKKFEMDFEKFNMELDLTKPLLEEQECRMSFFPMVPMMLSPKEMMPFLMIIHGGIGQIEGMDHTRQAMRCKMMLASEAGLGVIGGLLMYFDMWYDIDDRVCFDLVLEIVETIYNDGLIIYLYESLQDYVDGQDYTLDGVHSMTPPQAIILRILHILFAPAPAVEPILDDEKTKTKKVVAAKASAKSSDGDKLSGLGEVLDDVLGTKKTKGSRTVKDDSKLPHAKPTTELVEFLATKVFKSQLAPIVRDLIMRTGKLRQDVITGANTSSAELAESELAAAASEVSDISLYDVEINHEAILCNLELFTVFAEQVESRTALKRSNIVKDLVIMLQLLEQHVPRGTLNPMNAATKQPAVDASSSSQSAAEQLRPDSSDSSKRRAESEEPGDAAGFMWPYLKKTIVHLLSFLCAGDKIIQDEIREIGGMHTILNMCNLDEHNPYIREHAVLCIRNLLEKNTDNQKIVRELEALKIPVQSEILEQNGLQAHVDEQRKVKLGPKPHGNANNSGGGGGGGKKKKGKR